MQTPTQDICWMQRALQLAQHASECNEVPVGAVLISAEGTVIAEGWNQPISTCDPTAHAEMVALRAGAQVLNNYRLIHTTLYVTLEPCLMCVGAMLHARIKRLVYGAADPKTGAVKSLVSALNLPANHRILVTDSVLATDCGSLLSQFFQARR